MANEEKDVKRKPVNYKDGLLQLAEWTNTGDDGRTWKSYSIQRSYKDSNDNWKTTESLTRADLLKLANLAMGVYNGTASPVTNEDKEQA